MRGIPRAFGRSAYLLVWREEGALCVERLAVFCFLRATIFNVNIRCVNVRTQPGLLSLSNEFGATYSANQSHRSFPALCVSSLLHALVYGWHILTIGCLF